MTRKRILLTGVGEILTESAEKKLEQKDSYQIPTCDNGNTAEWYENIGIPLPPELAKKLKEQDKGIELEEEDYEEVHSEIMVWVDQIKLIVTDRELTTIFLEGDLTVTVLETVDEIDNYLDYLEMSWRNKIEARCGIFIRKIKRKFTGLFRKNRIIN